MNNIVGIYENRLVMDNPIAPSDPVIKEGSLCEFMVADNESGYGREMKTCIS
jgi:hypothetical protein